MTLDEELSQHINAIVTCELEAVAFHVNQALKLMAARVRKLERETQPKRQPRRWPDDLQMEFDWPKHLP